MPIKKMLTVYDEFQAILSLVGENRNVVEDLESVAINLKDDISLELLKELNNLVDYFGVYCNPFSHDCEDIILDLESEKLDIKEIEDISINIGKSSIYNEVSNLDYYFLDINSALKSMVSVDKKENDHKVNIGIPFCHPVETEMLNIISLDSETNLSQIEKKIISKTIDENVKLYLSYNKKDCQNYYYNPYSFIIAENNNILVNKYHKVIQVFFYLTLLEGISDKVQNGFFVLRGEKTINIAKSENFNTDNYNDFVKILFFLISKEKYMEKYLIVKKVFSFYISDDEDLSGLNNKMPNIRKTIRHYYNHYIEDDIKDFFKTKDQLLNEAMNVSKVIYEQTDKVTTSITASLLSVILVLVTTLYGIIDEMTINYFLTILCVFLIFSVTYYYLTKNTATKRYKLTTSQFDYFTQEMSLLRKSEIKSLKNIYLFQPYKEMKNTIRNLKYILAVINALIVIFFIVYTCKSMDFCSSDLTKIIKVIKVIKTYLF